MKRGDWKRERERRVHGSKGERKRVRGGMVEGRGGMEWKEMRMNVGKGKRERVRDGMGEGRGENEEGRREWKYVGEVNRKGRHG